MVKSWGVRIKKRTNFRIIYNISKNIVKYKSNIRLVPQIKWTVSIKELYHSGELA